MNKRPISLTEKIISSIIIYSVLFIQLFFTCICVYDNINGTVGTQIVSMLSLIIISLVFISPIVFVLIIIYIIKIIRRKIFIPAIIGVALLLIANVISILLPNLI